MTRRKQRGRGGGRGDRGGRGFSRGGRGGSRGRGCGLGFAMRDEIDDDFVLNVVPSYPRDFSRRGAPSPNARGNKYPGRGGFDHEPDYSDNVDNSDFYYNSRQSTPVRGASPSRGSSRGNGRPSQRGRGRWGFAGPELDLFEPKNVLRKRHLESKLRSGIAPLSQLLYEDRPYLRPITFVPSKETPILFLKDEEIFKPVAEEAGEQEASHAPTADRVYQIIHGGNSGPQPLKLLSDEEELLEIDYADLGRFMKELEATAASQKTITTTPTSTTAVSCISTSVQKVEDEPVMPTTEEEPTGFYIDTKPSPVQDSSTSTNHIAVEHPSTGILGEDIGDDDDDEIIVYVAPHPRISKLPSSHTQSSPDAKTLPPATDPVAAPVHQKTYDAPALPPKPEPKLSPEPVTGPVTVPVPQNTYDAPHAPALSSKYETKLWSESATCPVTAPVSQKTCDAPHEPVLSPKSEPKLRPEPVPLLPTVSKDIVVPALSPALTPGPSFKDFSFSHLSSPPKPTHRPRWPRRTAAIRKAGRSAALFSLRGAMRAEASLRELDPRRAEQRRGDSDVDWGGSTSGIADVEDNEEDGGMLVDPDIGTDAMSSFVRSMGVAGQAHVSAGDLEDEEKIRLEDAYEESASGSDDTELELADGLKGILAEDEDELASRSSFAGDDDDDSSEDEEETPRRSFQARLKRIRSRTTGRPINDMVREELDQDREPDNDPNSDSNSDIDDEDDIITQIEDFLDENDDIIRAHGRKQRNLTFRAIQNGRFEVEIDASPKRKRDKHKHIPEELQDQWERDRQKKAERKHLRELERIAAASADFFTPTKKKRKGKKERKKALKAAAAAATNLETIAGHMRAFVADLGGASTLALPPMEKSMRKLVHDLAGAFNLQSKSEGNGKKRFTTLSRTTLSGVRVDETKIARILGKPKPSLLDGGGGGGKGKGKAVGKFRPREGEVVGGAAPKIDQSNVGYRMMAGMGWQEGTRIGTVGGVGLDVPLLAVIKTTKLGLGASSRRG